MKYRFKTKKEFVKEFGDDWRYKVHYTFTWSMDYLLGREFDTLTGICWNISPQMFRKNICPPNPNVKVL